MRLLWFLIFGLCLCRSIAQTTTTTCTNESDATLGEDRNDWTNDPVQSEALMTDFAIPTPGMDANGCSPQWTEVEVCIDLVDVSTNGNTNCNLQGVYGNIFLDPPAMMDGSGQTNDEQILGGAGWSTGLFCIDLVASGYDISSFSTIGVDVVPAVDPNTDPDCTTGNAISDGFITNVEFDICIDFTYIYPTPPSADAGPDITLSCGDCPATIGANPVNSNGGFLYSWDSGDNGTLVLSGNPNNQDNGQVDVCPTMTTTYNLTVTDPNTGCEGYDSVTVTVESDTGEQCTDCSEGCMACSYCDPPAVADVAANCDQGWVLNCPYSSGDAVVLCSGFTAAGTSATLNLVLTTNCGSGPGPGGNVANFTWELYNAGGCNPIFQNGTLGGGLGVTGLTPGDYYNFCFFFDVPFGTGGSSCTHSEYYPYVIQDCTNCDSEAGTISITK